MKLASLTILFILTVATPFTLIAQEQPRSQIPAETITAESEAAITTDPVPPCPRQGMGMKHKHPGHHHKHHGDPKHRCKHHKQDKQERHQRVLQRLDMIDARLAKIEAMLESLMRR